MHGAFLHEDRIFCIKTGGMESIACAFMFKAHGYDAQSTWYGT
jgi:hypothetical protein